MTGSIAAIVTLGFGSFGSPGLVTTLGYGVGAEANRVEFALPVCRRAAVTLPVTRRAERTLPIYRRKEV